MDKLVAEYPIAVPYQVFDLHVSAFCDCRLTLVQETILGLIDAGITTLEDLRCYMGLTDLRMLTPQLVQLMSSMFVGENQGFFLTDAGKRVLNEEVYRAQAELENLTVRYDPYEEKFRYPSEKNLIRKPRKHNLFAMPLVQEISEQQVELAFHDIQNLIADHQEEVIERARLSSDTESIQVIKIRASRDEHLYLEADLRMYQDANTGALYWKVFRGGVENDKIAQQLRQLEAEGRFNLPDHSGTPDSTPAITALHQRAEGIIEATEKAEPEQEKVFLNTKDHRPYLFKALAEARESLIIFSPWLRTQAVNSEFLEALRKTLRDHRQLQIYFGYGIEKHSTRKQSWSQRNEDQALASLHDITRNKNYGSRLHLIEIGNTHEKIVICDHNFAIITSYNWLSYNSTTDFKVRRERGTVIRERQDIEDLLQDARQCLKNGKEYKG